VLWLGFVQPQPHNQGEALTLYYWLYMLHVFLFSFIPFVLGTMGLLFVLDWVLNGDFTSALNPKPRISHPRPRYTLPTRDPLVAMFPLVGIVRIILTEVRYTPMAQPGSFGALFGYRQPLGEPGLDGPMRGYAN